MRVLILSVYAEGQFGLARYFERALTSLGHETRFFTVVADTAKPHFDRAGVAGRFARRVVGRIQRHQVSQRQVAIADQVRRALLEFKPDVALTAKGIGIGHEILDVFAESNVALYNYYPDPIPLDDAAFLSTVPRYAGFFTYNRDQIPRLYWFGAKWVHYLPFASDRSIHVPTTPSAERASYYRSPVSYLATWQPHADYWPAQLMPFGLKIWGNQWSRLSRSHPLRSCCQGDNKGTYDELALVCASSKIVFNVVRAGNGLSHSMKTFEIPACGGFMLTNRTEEQVSFFREGVEAEYFSTAEELVDKTRFYLENEEARRRITEAGRVAAQGHRYEDRMREFVTLVRAHSPDRERAA